MQDYKAFIKELFTLEVRTKEQFVTKDGKIIADYTLNPALYPADADPVLHPNYYRATFLNLDHYDDHKETDRYQDKLRELMESAKSDVLLLDDNQITKLLVDAKRQRERLTRLVRESLEFDKKIKSATLDDPLCLTFRG